MLNVIIYILAGSLTVSLILVILYKGKINAICRSIYIANKKTKFIDEIEKWDENSGHSPFDKGIDTADVYATLSDCDMQGQASIKKELIKYGDINQL